MKPEQVQRLYDESYANQYNDKFIHSPIHQANMMAARDELAKHLQGRRWLDLACGTGHFLSTFPEHDRHGLDLSADMLRLAKERNPGVDFTHGSFLDAHQEWTSSWDLISCMWYAYGLLSTLGEVRQLLENCARWLRPGGVCFLPYANPRLIGGANFPDLIDYPQGEIRVDGVIWSFVEDNGAKIHEHQVAPSFEWITRNTADLFQSIELITLPAPPKDVLKNIDPVWADAVQPEQVILLRRNR